MALSIIHGPYAITVGVPHTSAQALEYDRIHPLCAQ